MKKLADMSCIEFHELLQHLTHDVFFHSRERLIELLNATRSFENRAKNVECKRHYELRDYERVFC